MELSHATYQALLPHQIVSTTGEILASPAGATPDKIGLIDGSRQWTFKELDQLANQFAQALLEKFGEGHSERMGPVGIIGKNSAEYFIAHF
ncbi:MAG: AMP-binding protein, partial [Rhodospirillaceae bacterium]|nr:AMP-binding protein [Rhodospirillaceae bacterium]